LLITDPEEVFTDEEINKLENDIRTHSLSLLVMPDWYDEISLRDSHFYDDNTHSEWYPITGGSNVPEINKLLDRFEMRIGYQSFSGSFSIHPALPPVSHPPSPLLPNVTSDRLPSPLEIRFRSGHKMAISSPHSLENSSLCMADTSEVNLIHFKL
jgi:hypothetical protein